MSNPTARHNRAAHIRSPRHLLRSRIARTLLGAGLAALAFLSGAARVRGQCLPPPTNLVSWWAAQGDASDVTGTNNGTPQGGVTFAAGEVGQAFSFDGVNGTVFVPDSPSLRITNQITIEAWINPTLTNGGDQSILGKVGGAAGDNGYQFGLSQNALKALFNSPGQGWPSAVISMPVAVAPHTWSHVAFTYDQSAMKLYFNGLPVATNVIGPAVINPSSSNLHISGDDDNNGYFNGLIDEVSVYNRALSAGEIAGIFAAGSAGKCVPPPTITSQPQSQSATVGNPATLAVGAAGGTPLSYQWVLNSNPIPGATNPTLNFVSVQLTNAATYAVVVTNLYGSTRSSNAVLTVNSAVCTPPPANLVGWWQGEGDVADVTGTNGGSLQGGATFASGKVGEAFSFSGSGQYVKIPKTPSLDVGNQVTVEFWMKADPTNALKTFQGLVVSDFYVVEVSTGTGSTWGVSFGISTDGGSTFPDTTDVPGNGGGAPVSSGVWHHIAGTYDGTNILLYVDGQQWRNPYPHSGALSPMSANGFVSIGSENGRLYCPACTANRYFLGLIDEASIYNRALSAGEIAAIYNAASAGKCGPPPTVMSQPQNLTVNAGYSASFTATVAGARPFSYQWLLNSLPVPGATNLALNIANVQVTNAGNYKLFVSSAYGQTTSSNALLTVTSPTTRYVDATNTAPSAPYTTWSTAARNIQDAVSLSMSGDQVLVTNGIYQFGGQVVFGAMTNRVAVTQPYVTVQSVNGPGVTTILGHQVPGTRTGNAAVRCVYLTNGAVLAGFTLNAGATRSTGDVLQEESGGGVWCASTNSVVSNCVLFGNAAFSNGGGVCQGTITNSFLSGDSAGAAGGGAYQATLNNCILDAGSANNGGGAANSTLNQCTLDSDAASTDGGGAYGCQLNDCMLTGNSATFGGGAYLGSLTNCELNGNSSGSQGGGADQAILNNCTVVNNSSPAGGGAYNCTATSSLLAGNTASSQGGGVDLGIFNNCTLTGNTSSNAGGGAISATLRNSLVYFNMALTSTNFDASSQLTNCCTFPPPAIGAGNITNAPLFVNQGAGDFHLLSTSPCVNAGNNSYVTAATDLDGNPRIVGGTVDIGAYEFQSDTGSFAVWLQQYGFPTNGSADYLDSDGTGMNNWQKWRAGLNPTNAASVLKMTGAVRANPGVAVTWQSVSGITYYLQRAGSVQIQPAFTSIQSNIFGQPVTTTIVDPTATGPGPFFYRVGVE
jgi:hypothetical protein